MGGGGGGGDGGEWGRARALLAKQSQNGLASQGSPTRTAVRLRVCVRDCMSLCTRSCMSVCARMREPAHVCLDTRMRRRRQEERPQATGKWATRTVPQHPSGNHPACLAFLASISAPKMAAPTPMTAIVVSEQSPSSSRNVHESESSGLPGGGGARLQVYLNIRKTFRGSRQYYCTWHRKKNLPQSKLSREACRGSLDRTAEIDKVHFSTANNLKTRQLLVFVRMRTSCAHRFQANRDF